ncbi:hypothetical protein [Brevibacillus nitrificans]|uniref:hypothetical protein n=1 Tax=Brevibacillus nitrificans TaxID=651560 RepID=UPI00260B7BC1|nr:hypothetical protein [Brevibacillus nitrificans]MED1795178.1 hypothetical protein [Brevibacillus nitrificans]
MKTFVIEGNNFHDYSGLCKEFNRTVFHDLLQWNGTLDAFNDLLRDIEGTIIWKNFAQSKKTLSYSETIKLLRERLEYCHPSNIPFVREKLKKAELGMGPTVLDWILEIISEDENVALILE